MTKPTSAAAARRAAKANARNRRDTLREMPVEIAERILSYRPRTIDATVWDAVRPAVVEIVVRSDPSSPDHAQHRMLPVAKLAVWAAGEGISLDASTLLSELVVEEWAKRSIAAGESTGSVATHRSLLRTIATAVLPPSTPTTASIPRRATAEPYTATEDLALRRAVSGQRSAVYRRVGCAIYGLSRGAGLDTGDLGQLRSSDLTDNGDSIRVDVAGRTVWVLTEFCDIVRLGLPPGGGDDLLLGGDGRRTRNIGGTVDRFTIPSGTPRLSVARCRATWIVDHLNRDTPVGVIRDALGVTGLRPIEAVLPWANTADDTARERLLRGKR